MAKHIEKADVEAVLEYWRAAMNIIQALEGRVYTEPLNGFSRFQRAGIVRRLQTDHLKQKYRWISRPTKTMPAPALAIFEENYRLMYRLFHTDLTYVATDGPHLRESDVMNRAPGDDRRARYAFKCDTCHYMGKKIPCVRAEERTDVWVCKCCYLFHRPCTFTAFSEARDNLWGNDEPLMSDSNFSQYPTGPHRFLAFHHTTNLEQAREVRNVKEPLSEKLLVAPDDAPENDSEAEDGEQLG